VHTTFEAMGLRAEKAVATHLLLENAYESNLVPDIAKVDYLAGHQGRTHLRPLEGLPVFVDDLYVFGYLDRDECVFQRGAVSCTTGDAGAAKIVVARIATAVRCTIGKDRGHIQTNIVHTVSATHAAGGGAIRATIRRIEQDTVCAAKTHWRQLYPDGEVAALFVAKVDVSDVPIDELLSALPGFRLQLLANGYDLYSIDYTRDFSGVLDRETLVAYLRDTHGFREQGDLVAAIGEDAPTILDNTGSVGNHVCTWVQTTPHGYTVRTKLYNKVVSNFEAGEIRETFGGHLADYVDCPNAHLRRTFLHPDVQARGCTRIEVSLYACRGEATLSAETGNEVVQAALDIVSPEGEGLFVVQPPAAQWRNLAAAIDRCLVLANRPQGEIYVAWYAHTTTGRVAGVRIRPTKTNTDDDARWEKAIELAIGDFGFRACPIFRVDILGTAIEDGIELAPLRCYTKSADTHTILAASKRPAQLHPDAPDPATLLPATPRISWVWRKEKCSAFGKETPAYPFEEVAEIAAGRQISTLSTRNRERRLEEIRDAADAEQWRREAAARQQAAIERFAENRKTREEELRRLEAILGNMRETRIESEACRRAVAEVLAGKCAKVADNLGLWNILGYRRYPADKTTNPRVVLVRHGEQQDASTSVWATAGLERILATCEESFEHAVDAQKKTLYWLPRKAARLQIAIEPAQTFLPKGSSTPISWNPIRILATPAKGQEEALSHEAIDEIECQAIRARLAVGVAPTEYIQEVPPPKTKDATPAIELPAGEYMCGKFAAGTFRGAARTYLFLQPVDANGTPTTDVETPTYGVFLELAVGSLGGVAELRKKKTPLLVRLDRERTTQKNKKDRLVAIVSS
jgi:hypothetical protein